MKTDKIREEIDKLVKDGIEIQNNLLDEEKYKKKCFRWDYEIWYSKALLYVKKINPSREKDFIELYKLEKRKEVNVLTYTISDALLGIEIPVRNISPNTAVPKLQQQIMILKSVKEILITRIYNLEQLIQADVFDNELKSARELSKKGFLRASGAICGVVLEEHFQKVIELHSLIIKKKNPCLSDYNDLLKDNAIIDVPQWRFIQRLSDIRNLCDHKKDREPKIDEINDLLLGTDKVIKEIF